MPKIIRNGITYTGLPSINYDCEITTVTLYAANWSNGVYTITDSRIDGTSVQEYMPGLGITDEQLEALQAANIHDYGQDAGHAYLKAYGDVPEIDIPIRVMFNPGVKTKEVDASNSLTYLGEFTVSGGSQTEQTLLDYYDNYQSIMLVLVVNNLLLASTIVPTDYIGGSRTDAYVSYTSDSQAVIYTRFNTSSKNKLSTWSSSNTARTLVVYGLFKKN